MPNKTKDLHSCLQSLFFIFRALGLAPFEYNAKKQRNRFQSSKQLFKYSILVCALNPLVGLTSYIIKVTFSHSVTMARTLLHVSELINQSFMYVTYIVFVVSLLLYRDRLVEVLNSLVEIDKCLLGYQTDLKDPPKRTVALGLLGVFTILGIPLCFDFVSNTVRIGHSRAALLIFTNLIFSCVYFGNLQFVTFLLVIKQRLGVINGEVKDIVKELSSSCGDYDYDLVITRRVVNPVVIKNRPQDIYWLSLPIESQRSRLRDIASRLTSMRENHYRLFKVAVTVNDVNGLPLLLTLMSTLTNVVVNTHICVCYLTTSDHDRVLFLAALAKLLWATVYALLAFQLTLACYKTKEEYKRTASLIQDVLYDGKRIDKALWKEFNSFLGQIANTRLRFSANGFCDVDFGLLCGMAGAVVTYLMVLFQIN